MGTQLSSDDDNEQVKIDTVINSLKAAEHLDKQQLHEAFLSAGLDEVNETVGNTNDDNTFYESDCCSLLIRYLLN